MTKDQPGLTLEQKFNLRSFSDQISHMSEAQSRSYLSWLYDQYVIREAFYRQISGNKWTIELPKL